MGREVVTGCYPGTASLLAQEFPPLGPARLSGPLRGSGEAAIKVNLLSFRPGHCITMATVVFQIF